MSYHVSVVSFVGAVFKDDAAVPGRCGSFSGAETEAYAGCARDGRLATANHCCLRESLKQATRYYRGGKRGFGANVRRSLSVRLHRIFLARDELCGFPLVSVHYC